MVDLLGVRALVAEDEYFIAMILSEDLVDRGCQVIGPFGDLADVIAAADTEQIDIAVLDMNLRGLRIHPAVKVLRARGVPVLLYTGYGSSDDDEELVRLPRVMKPGTESQVAEAIGGLLGK